METNTRAMRLANRWGPENAAACGKLLVTIYDTTRGVAERIAGVKAQLRDVHCLELGECSRGRVVAVSAPSRTAGRITAEGMATLGPALASMTGLQTLGLSCEWRWMCVVCVVCADHGLDEQATSSAQRAWRHWARRWRP